MRMESVTPADTAIAFVARRLISAMTALRQGLIAIALTFATTLALATPTTPSEDFTDNQDGTVTHRITGLTWMRCAMGMTWTGSTCSGTASTYTWDPATKLTLSFAGKTDWRLPSIAELNTIVEREAFQPAINGAVFPGTPGLSSFWSGTPVSNDQGKAWHESFFTGYPDVVSKSDFYNARLVRNGQPFNSLVANTPTSDFFDNQDGTVTHFKTGLMWKRCTEGQAWSGTACSGVATRFDWITATNLTSGTGGHNDWRVPSAHELLTIVEYQSIFPAINVSIFPSTPVFVFWSSTPYVIQPDIAWFVGFGGGSAHMNPKSDPYYVRLVRSGQFFSPLGFGNQSGVPVNALITSSVRLVGAEGVQPITITGGTYSINSGPYTANPGIVNLNDSIQVRLTSAATVSTIARATVVIGTVSADFNVMTNAIADKESPSIPDGLTAVAFGDNSIRLRWNAARDNVGVNGYRLFRNGSVLALLGNVTSHVDTGLSSNAEFSYSVGACDASNNCSAQGAVATALTAVPYTATPTTPTADFTDNLDGTVTHRITGLTWMRCAVGTSWTGVTCSGYPTAYSWSQATNLTSNFAGKSDWRLPSIAELNSIVEWSTSDPALNPLVFPAATRYSNLWSASSDAQDSGKAWWLASDYGSSHIDRKTVALHVRLVRGGQPFNVSTLYTPTIDFVDNGDGTVTHLKTGLMWKRCSEGQVWTSGSCSGSAVGLDWNVAIRPTAKSAGYSDWRAPSVSELLTIVEYQASSSTINTNIFPKTQSVTYWSSSSYAAGPAGAWHVDFLDATTASGSKAYTYYVRLVRNGQFFSPLGFNPQTGSTLNAAVTSNVLKLSPVSTSSAISITGGQYSINNAPYTSSPGTINPNDTVNVRVTSAPAPGTTTRATLTIGAISGDFAITTASDIQVPSAPATLTAIATNNNQITLTWPASTDNTDVTTYRVYRNGNLLTTAGTTTYTDTPPNVGAKARYTVQACDAAGNCSALSSLAAVTLSGTSSAAAKLSAGGNHGAALKSDGSLLTWGSNDSGQLGLGVPPASTETRNTPQPLGTGYASLSLGGSHSVALKQDGSLWTWGGNASGQIGDGSTITRIIPIPIGSGYMTVAAGNAHTLGIKSDGSLWSWGNNGSGQLGDGTSNPALSPLQVGSGFYTVAGGTSHSAAIKTDGTLWAWGSNNFGQLGDSTGNDRYAPNLIGKGFTFVAAGAFHTVALKNDGSLWAWGKNDAGQLGDGTTQNRYAPLQIGTGFSAIAAGAAHTLGLKTDGTLWSWGGNESGQLGLGNTTTSSLLLQKIPGLAGVTSIAAGGYTSLALKNDGTALSWGSNNTGQLGDGTFGLRTSAVLVVKTGATGFLNLAEDTVLPVPPALNVPFFVTGSGSISGTSATVSTSTRFNPADAGKAGAVYVTAMVPTGSLGAIGVARGAYPTMFSALVGDLRAAATAATPAYTLVQLTSTGWKTVVNGQLVPYASGVLTDQFAAQNILNNAATTALPGAEFCVGYGTSAEDMLANGNMRVVATIPGATAPTSCVVGGTLTVGLSVKAGWNLLGNPVKQSISVADKFGDGSKVTSVWKWDSAKGSWQFFGPGLTATDLLAYASSQGFGVLSEINGGDGYWVNAKTSADFGSIAGEAITLRQESLASGWNLMATGNPVTPQNFNLTLSTVPPTLGQVPINMESLWAWDSAQSNWFFYAPGLDAQGGSALANYIKAQNYEDFRSNAKTLGNGVGFWVRRP